MEVERDLDGRRGGKGIRWRGTEGRKEMKRVGGREGVSEILSRW